MAYYLNELCNITYISPFEREISEACAAAKFVPVRKKPWFFQRNIGFTTQNDNGRYSVLRGLNGMGDRTVLLAENYAMQPIFGSPNRCHTFHLYFSAQKYFDAHPEWFAEVNGKRYKGTPRTKGQLCLSNRELRKNFTAKLLAFIEADRKNAKARNIEPPAEYDVSQNDARRFCTCTNCTALAKKYGNTQSGVMLDFVNEIAGNVTKIHPEIRITTFAYQYTEPPPVGIKPHPAVTVVLCDTISNTLQSISHPDNKLFADKIRAWGKLASRLRVWDYAVNFMMPNELPYNSEDSYQGDMRFFRANKVVQLYTEFEYAVTADVRDYKLYLVTGLINNPDTDVNALKWRFAKACYGPAAELFLDYRDLLKKSQNARKTELDWFPITSRYTHLDYVTVRAAHDIFDRGEKLLANDPVRLRRWRFAWLSLDRATLILDYQIKQGYYLRHGKTLAGYPFDRDLIRRRIKSVLDTEVPVRKIKNRVFEKFQKDMTQEFAEYPVPFSEKSLDTAEKFRHVSPGNILDIAPANMRFARDYAGFTDDPQAVSGHAIKIDIANSRRPEAELTPPLAFGIYSRPTQKNHKVSFLPLEKIVPDQYHWYKVCRTKLKDPGMMIFFCFTSWSVQTFFSINDFTGYIPDAWYDFYVRAKFTGPRFGGKNGSQNFIYIDRFVIVRENK